MQEYILPIAGTLITLLLSSNIYFVKRFVTTVDKLRELIAELRLLVEIQKTKSERWEQRLTDHANRLKALETDVAVLKSNQTP